MCEQLFTLDEWMADDKSLGLDDFLFTTPNGILLSQTYFKDTKSYLEKILLGAYINEEIIKFIANLGIPSSLPIWGSQAHYQLATVYPFGYLLQNSNQGLGHVCQTYLACDHLPR